MNITTLPPLGLYVHIPWCVRKCPYCDFNSHESPADIPEKNYIAALAADMNEEQQDGQGRKLSSIFIGGGTPSLFSDAGIGQILEHAEKTFGFEHDIEITLEANPGTFEQERFKGYALAGVNRLSIGIQSFQDTQLQRLGRIHGRSEALHAADKARRAGFDNINLDLMHGLPEQSLDAAMADLKQALAFAPNHLSWYQLTIEQNTEFFSRPPALPEEDILVDIQDAGQQLLEGAAYKQYEVSAYSQSGQQSRHNLNYWQFGDYIGVGAGAHGKITRLHSQSLSRRRKTRMPAHYMAALSGEGNFVAAEEAVPDNKRKLEFLMNALRLNQGVTSELLSARTGLALGSIDPQWQRLKDKGLIVPTTDRIQASALGLRFLNTVLEGFLD